jgi:glucose/mannose transport system permease protein
MALRWSKITPQIALAPAVAVTAVAFVGSIAWTVYLSLTKSKRLPDYTIDWADWTKQYRRIFNDDGWTIAFSNLIFLAAGSALAILFGFILAAMIDREKRGQDIFRTLFLYPLAVSLIVTGVAWRWILNPAMGLEAFLQSHGITWIHFNWLAEGRTAMYAIILASVWQSAGFYMALMLSGLKSINTEIWSAARLDGISVWRLYIEVIIPMMKYTFLTCAILLSLGVIKAYDIVLAMTNGGPGQSTWVPGYYTIDALAKKQNLGLASAAAVMMLLFTLAVFIPLVLLTWRRQRAEAAA